MSRYIFVIIACVVICAAWPSYSGGTTVYSLQLQDQIITPTVSEYIRRGIAQAEANGSALIIELDTPGGLLASTQDIVKSMMNAKVPVVVYVSPSGGRAASAGMFITVAAHVAAMAPSTRIGAAHPVSIGGKSPGMDFPVKDPTKEQGKAKKDEMKASDNPMSDKIMQDTVAWVKGIAKERGRNVEWAVEAVVDSRSSTATEALELKVIDLLASSMGELIEQLHGRVVTIGGESITLDVKDQMVMIVPMNQRERILQVISNPNIAYILMMLGFYGLLFEITHPGSWVPGIAGAICLILAFYAMQTLPTNYAGLAFIALSIILFLAEIKVTSYGFLALAGVGCLVFGSLILFDSPGELMKVSIQVVAPVVIATATVALGLGYLAFRSQRAHVAVGAEGMVGRLATVDRELAPCGKVDIDGEIWDAEAKETIPVGEKVEVVQVVGMRLTVKRRT